MSLSLEIQVMKPNLELVSNTLFESGSLKMTLSSSEDFCNKILNAYQILNSCILSGGTIYSCGNGGSTCDSMHLTEELVARYKKTRPGIKAMHFADAATITCWSNDVSFLDVFKRYAETFCTDKDVLIAISTSGNSPNVLVAAEEARLRGSKIIALTGRDGGALTNLADVAIIVPSDKTERIQECHISIIHILCELLES